MDKGVFAYLYSTTELNTGAYIKISKAQALTGDEAIAIFNIWKYRQISDIPFHDTNISNSEIIKNIEIKFNKMQRQSLKSGNNYNILNKWKNNRIYNNDNIYEFNFGLNNLQNMPMGHCNLNHINTPEIIFEFNENPENIPTDIDLIIINTRYNILRLKNGIAEILL